MSSKLLDTCDKEQFYACMAFFLWRDNAHRTDLLLWPIGPRLPWWSCVVCFQHYRLSPKMQHFLRHRLSVDQSGPLYFDTPVPPFRITGNIASSRLGDKTVALDAWTSDEFCKRLLTTSSDWSICPLVCTLDPDSSCLLTAICTRLAIHLSPPRRFGETKPAYPRRRQHH